MIRYFLEEVIERAQFEEVCEALRAVGFRNFTMEEFKPSPFPATQDMVKLVAQATNRTIWLNGVEIPLEWLELRGESPVYLHNRFFPLVAGATPIRVGGRDDAGQAFYAWADANRDLESQFPKNYTVGNMGK